MEILYIKGDATAPIGSGVKVITHICNDIGGWGKGFVLALSKKWKMPEEAYRQWYKSQEEFTLGAVYNPQIQISAESETKRSIFREKDKTKRSKKESAQHSKSRNKSFVMTSVSAL